MRSSESSGQILSQQLKSGNEDKTMWCGILFSINSDKLELSFPRVLFPMWVKVGIDQKRNWHKVQMADMRYQPLLFESHCGSLQQDRDAEMPEVPASFPLIHVQLFVSWPHDQW